MVIFRNHLGHQITYILKVTLFNIRPVSAGATPAGRRSNKVRRIVMRYNTFNFANATCAEYWDIHGFQNWPGNGQTGTMVVEYYGNTLYKHYGVSLDRASGWMGVIF